MEKFQSFEAAGEHWLTRQCPKSGKRPASRVALQDIVRTGGCHCEGVRYRVVGELRDVVNCFCQQCQKTSGHHFAATRAHLDQFELLNDSTLAWYEASPEARRGFCTVCGSSLFWQRHGTDTISITAGTLDRPTGLKTVSNIFVEDMSDYHALPELSEVEVN